MTVEVKLVQSGMAMQAGTVVSWLKAIGDEVQRGEIIGEVETEKSTLDILCTADGVLVDILVPEGVEVPVRTTLAIVAAPGETYVGGADQDAARRASQAPTAAVPPPSSSPSPPDLGPGATVQVTPAARKVAKDLGIDLATVNGSGPQGRITEADVRAHTERPSQPEEPSPPAALDPRPVSASSLPAEDISRTIPLTGIRGTIATRMVSSLRAMAQLTLSAEVDVTDLVAARAERQGQLRVTFNHLLARACALALTEHPILNAVIEDDQIHVARPIHLGLAVQAGDRLVVPVLRNAEALNLRGIVKASDALTDEVRSGRAGPDTFAGGTFTISNLGAYGVDVFTPIVNPPQVAILGVGRIVDRPARSDDALLWWRKAMTLSLTIDHRAVDGAPGAAFLRTLGGILGNPEALFL